MKVNGMKKADVILGISIAAVSLALFAARFFLQKEGASVTVEINGETYGTYELDEEQVIDIGSTNQIEIKDNTVRMVQADCPDHLCVKQGKIKSEGEMIVCLPNKVTVRISGEDAFKGDDQPDVIAH